MNTMLRFLLASYLHPSSLHTGLPEWVYELGLEGDCLLKKVDGGCPRCVSLEFNLAFLPSYPIVGTFSFLAGLYVKFVCLDST